MIVKEDMQPKLISLRNSIFRRGVTRNDPHFIPTPQCILSNKEDQLEFEFVQEVHPEIEVKVIEYNSIQDNNNFM